jgi:hypothetical protein
MSYEGRRVRIPGSERVYLVLEGARRWIPSLVAHDRLFDTWAVDVSAAHTAIPLGPDFSADVTIAQCCPTLGLSSLYSAGMYRHIVSPDVFNRYQFSWNPKKRQICAGASLPPDLLGPPIL